jgi:hypothetical protein
VIAIECVHYWIIDDNGLGHCRKCGKVRQFTADWDEHTKKIAVVINAKRPKGGKRD